MTSDTHGPTQYLWAGVIKRKRRSSIHRISKVKQRLIGAKAQRARFKTPITLAVSPFDPGKGDAQ